MERMERMKGERRKERLLHRDTGFGRHQDTISYIAMEDCM